MRAVLYRNVFPTLAKRSIVEIKRSEITALLDRLEDDRGPCSADQSLAFIRAVMNWHASRVDDYTPPIVRGMTRTSTKERQRERILTEGELRAVWRATGLARLPGEGGMIPAKHPAASAAVLTRTVRLCGFCC